MTARVRGCPARAGRALRGAVVGLGLALLLGGCLSEPSVELPPAADDAPSPHAPSFSAVSPGPDTPSAAPASPEPGAPSSAPASPEPDDAPSPSPTDEPASEPTTALEALALLEVRPRDPKTGYDRDLFAYRSVDLDRNGCDTRNDILRRDLHDVVLKPGTHGCVVLSGVLHDPFTGDAIVFERGDSANLVQIDHVVALSDAWQKGAQHLAEAALHGIGNDPLNLLAVYGPANQQKGDGDAATWLPRNKAFRCAYVARQVAVKHAYGLWVVQPEKDAIERVLAGCPHEPLPDAGTVPEVPAPTATIAPQPPSSKPDPQPTQAPDGVYYENCTAAREAGVTPIYQGQPGYGRHLDRDGDGVACE